ncbi:MAG: DUF4290 domain-containing protein [Bacteroidales bacterium]|nr:DUF4290 domain-containing protein [Bacteroidales bacterium]
MYENANNAGLDYNTEREKLLVPEFGRNILKMVEQLRGIEDRAKRTEQAAAIVKVMEILNPQVRQQEDYVHRLWDQLYIISGFDLDVDSPFPPPTVAEIQSHPVAIPLRKRPLKAAHYGRNIESIIDLIAGEPDGEVKTAMIRSLAIYMRQQYLIWNKDSVADETIFKDIEVLSEGRIKVPEGISLSKISGDANFARPGFGQAQQGNGSKRNRNGKNWKNKKKQNNG